MQTSASVRLPLISLATATILMTGCGDGGSDSLNIPQSVSLKENSGTTVTRFNNSDKYTFKLSGADKSAFTIESDGTLKFLQAPDYETKKVYHITVEVYEGEKKIAQKAITVNITDDPTDNSDATAPVFDTAASLEVQENRLQIATIQAHDDTGAVTFAITGGADKTRLQIDPNSGLLSFNHFTPDFEHPSDQNRDNVYEIVITATDNASNQTPQTFTVRVTDVDDTGSASDAKVLKTGLDDGPNGGPGFGDPRTISQSGNMISVGDDGLLWEDSAHIDADVTYDEALTYCQQNGWRVPTRKELYELVNYGKSPMNDDGFTHKNNGDFWTKTTLLEGRTYQGQNFEVTEKAWYISFRAGDDDFADKTTKKHVRCVTGGTTFSTSGSFEEHADYIEDTLTRLKWENNDTAIAKHLTWHEAKARCEALPGGTWRLPNINELHTLMPESGMDVLIYAHLQEGLSIGPFWSSSTVPYNTEQAYYMENREYKDPGCDDNDDATICRYGDTQNNAVESKNLNSSIRSICVSGGRL